MSLSDDVRKYCIDNYILPMREKGDNIVLIRAGDIHTAMGYNNRLPLVCSSLGSKKFENIAKVQRVSIEGPLNGSNTTFIFRLI